MKLCTARKGILCLSTVLVGLVSRANAATWTPLNNLAPSSAGTMFLLTDGTVMVQAGGSSGWMKLTPDGAGNYANGTWSSIASMSVGRLYYASTMLPSGKVLVLGGEYTGSNSDRTDTNTGEIYDPVADSWKAIANYPPEADCGDATVTSNGTLTTGSNVITGLEFTGVMQTMWTVTGNGIPGTQVSPTTITSILSPTSIQISANATTTGQSSLSFTGNRPGCFGAVAAILLNSGNFLAGNLHSTATNTYNPLTDSWTSSGSKVYDQSDEEGWLKLPSGGIFNPFDIFRSINTGLTSAELYDPVAGTWASKSPSDIPPTANGMLPQLSSFALGAELGPTIRLQDGRVLVIGANNNTALYNPTTNTWFTGPTIMGTLSNSVNTAGSLAPFGADDAPAAILPNGHVIFAADAGPAAVTSTGDTSSTSQTITGIPSTALFQIGWEVRQSNGNSDVIQGGTTIESILSSTSITVNRMPLVTTPGEGLIFGGTFNNPTQLFDFNPAGAAGAGSILPVSPPLNYSGLNNSGSYVTRMLVLPTGQLLFNPSSQQLYIYTPDGSASLLYRSAVNAITYSGIPGQFTLTGRQLNGQSAGSSYGDDVQVDENYPIIRLTSSTGTVYYCRTTNWSNLGVATGTASEMVTFTLPNGITAGTYSLVVSGAGISGVPVAFNITAAEIAGIIVH